MLIAEDIQVEWDEGGCFLMVDGERWKVADPEQLYDRVKAAIGPWLRERDEAFAEFKAQHMDVRIYDDGKPPVTDLAARLREVEFHCNPDESGGYDVSDPKHPDYHSVHVDLWDNREKS